MNKILATVIGLIVVTLLGFATYGIIDGNAKMTNFDNYDFYSIIEGTKDNGNISDHVKGDPEAEVLIFEYADYQCPGCATMNPKINKAIEALDGKVAVVYRNFLLSYHQNGTAAASAAEAAGLQGYWKQFADTLFERQAEWEYANSQERDAMFKRYFMEVTEDKGDLEKFAKDIASSEVSKKISFDMGIGKRIDIGGTPALYVDGQLINWSAAGSIKINGHEIAWSSSRGAEADLIQLFKDIVNAKEK